jgi:hypothetical protein
MASKIIPPAAVFGCTGVAFVVTTSIAGVLQGALRSELKAMLQEWFCLAATLRGRLRRESFILFLDEVGHENYTSLRTSWSMR